LARERKYFIFPPMPRRFLYKTFLSYEHRRFEFADVTFGFDDSSRAFQYPVQLYYTLHRTEFTCRGIVVTKTCSSTRFHFGLFRCPKLGENCRKIRLSPSPRTESRPRNVTIYGFLKRRRFISNVLQDTYAVRSKFTSIG